jgi:uncharacterized iron-regulated membrane protein
MIKNDVDAPLAPRRPATSDASSGALARTGEPRSSHGFYRTVWRWHFYAGLIVAPVLLLASLTGAGLVFERELQQWFWPARFVARSDGATKHPLAAQVTVAREQVEAGATLARISIGEWPRATTRLTFDAPGGRRVAVAVDPYANTVQATFDPEREFFHVLTDLHRTLLAGDVGRYVIELATAWGLVLVLTGLYLWWPRGTRANRNGPAAGAPRDNDRGDRNGGGDGRRGWRGGGGGTFVPRVRGPLYTLLRDWHAVPVAYASVVLIAILASAFVFSKTNGGLLQWHMRRTGAMPSVFIDPPKATPIDGASPTAGLDGIDRALATYQRPGWGLEASAPTDPTDTYNLFIVRHAHGTVDFDGVAVDPYTGAHLDHFSHADATFSFDLMRYGYALHTGSILGTPSKVLALMACVVLAGATISGAAMWWARRPAGRAGLPRRPGRADVPVGAALLILVMGILLPTLGASILLLLAIAWVRSRYGANRITEGTGFAG